MQQDPGTRAVVELADPGRRIAAAHALAQQLGVAAVMVMLRDPLVDALVPAPGFPQTLRGGPGWRAFLDRCRESGRHVAHLDCEGIAGQRVEAFVLDGLALLMCGAEPDPAVLARIEPMFPLLAYALHGELRVALARSEADDARSLAGRAQVLANALDAARQEATRLNAQLREGHRRKDEFLAMLAHELRNPLSPLVTSIEILRRRASGSDGDTDRLLGIMRRQTSHLSRLVDDLLDISRVTRGKIELRPETLGLWEVVNNAVEVNRALMEAKGHELLLKPPAATIKVHGDPVRLTQVVSNLLHNAAKYTPPNGRIEVEAGSDSREAFVRITDNGIGIAREMIDSIFDLFAQAPSAPEQSLGGLGIGLTLVRRVVELHGGTVAVSSAGEGMGSQFTVTLPLVSSAPVAAGAPGTGAAIGRERAESTAGGRHHVLVVDDNTDAADSLAELLHASGHHVLVAHDGPQAIEMAGRERPDVVLLDLGLPDEDGLKVIEAVRAKGTTPIVVLSARNAEAVKVAALDLGADDYVTKPFGVDELLARLRAALRHGVQARGSQPVVRTGDLEIDMGLRRVTKGGEVIRLSPKEYDLLVELALQLGRPVAHGDLLRAVWGSEAADIQYLRVYMGQLRAKLERDPAAPTLLISEPAIGYRLALAP